MAAARTSPSKLGNGSSPASKVSPSTATDTDRNFSLPGPRDSFVKALSSGGLISGLLENNAPSTSSEQSRGGNKGRKRQRNDCEGRGYISIVANEPYEVFSIKDSNHILAYQLFGQNVVQFTQRNRKLFLWLDTITFWFQSFCCTGYVLFLGPQSSISLPISAIFFAVQFYTLFSFSFVIQVPLFYRSLRSFDFYFIMIEFALFTMSLWSSFCFTLDGIFLGSGLWTTGLLSAALHDSFSVGRRRRFQFPYLVSWTSYFVLFCCVSFRLIPDMCVYRLDLNEGLVLENAISSGLVWTPWSFSFNDMGFNTGITVVIMLARAVVSGRRDAGKQLMLTSKLTVHETQDGTEEHERLLMRFEDLHQHVTSLSSYKPPEPGRQTSKAKKSLIVPSGGTKGANTSTRLGPANSCHNVADTKKEKTGLAAELVSKPEEAKQSTEGALLPPSLPIVARSGKAKITVTRGIPSDNDSNQYRSKLNIHIASLPIYMLSDEEAATSVFAFGCGKATTLVNLLCRREKAVASSRRTLNKSEVSIMRAPTLTFFPEQRQSQDALSEWMASRRERLWHTFALSLSYLVQGLVFFSHSVSPLVPMEQSKRTALLAVSNLLALGVMLAVDSHRMNWKIFQLLMRRFATVFFLLHSLVFCVSVMSIFCFSLEGILFALGYYSMLLRCILYDCFRLPARKHLRFSFLSCTFALVAILIMIRTRTLSKNMCYYRYDFKRGLLDDLIPSKIAVSSSAAAGSQMLVESLITKSSGSYYAGLQLDSTANEIMPQQDTGGEQMQGQGLSWSLSVPDFALNCGFTLCLLFTQHLLSLLSNPEACIVLQSSFHLIEVFGQKNQRAAAKREHMMSTTETKTTSFS